MSPAATSDLTALTSGIKDAARRVGFDLVGIAPAVTPDGFSALREWIGRGFAGEMHYLERRERAYAHPREVLAPVKSLIVLGLNYKTEEPPEPGTSEGRVSRYAWGERDYHELIREKLRHLADYVHAERPGCKTRGVVDTAPLLERDFARLAGLGWFGKNTMLLNKRAGSWLFLAALLVDVELEYDRPHETAHCGTCTRCLDACPTDAFPEPYVLDARKCISYLTIELRTPVPTELRDGMGAWLFGCDVCQDVCPWNRKAPQSAEPAFHPAGDLRPADAVELLQMDEAAFEERFGDTALARPGRAGLLRNAAIVLGNAKDASAAPALATALDDSESLIRGAAAWALGKIGGTEAGSALNRRASVEDNPEVREEIAAALKGEGETG